MATKAERLRRTENRQKAMADPLRREVLLHMIEHGVSSPSEIAGALGEKTPKISYHCKKLVALDCAELVNEEKAGGSLKHNYRATERHLIDDSEWEDMDPLIREGLLISFMQPGIADFEVAARAGTLGADERFHITRTPMKGLDHQGFKEVLELHRQCFEKALEVQAQAAVRLADSDEEPINVSSFQGCFQVPHF